MWRDLPCFGRYLGVPESGHAGRAAEHWPNSMDYKITIPTAGGIEIWVIPKVTIARGKF